MRILLQAFVGFLWLLSYPCHADGDRTPAQILAEKMAVQKARVAKVAVDITQEKTVAGTLCRYHVVNRAELPIGAFMVGAGHSLADEYQLPFLPSNWAQDKSGAIGSTGPDMSPEGWFESPQSGPPLELFAMSWQANGTAYFLRPGQSLDFKLEFPVGGRFNCGAFDWSVAFIDKATLDVMREEEKEAKKYAGPDARISIAVPAKGQIFRAGEPILLEFKLGKLLEGRRVFYQVTHPQEQPRKGAPTILCHGEAKAVDGQSFRASCKTPAGSYGRAVIIAGAAKTPPPWSPSGLCHHGKPSTSHIKSCWEDNSHMDGDDTWILIKPAEQ